METSKAIRILKKRREHLMGRIKEADAKGVDLSYDKAEASALENAIRCLAGRDW